MSNQVPRLLADNIIETKLLDLIEKLDRGLLTIKERIDISSIGWPGIDPLETDELNIRRYMFLGWIIYTQILNEHI
jgi:hypothetical protein